MPWNGKARPKALTASWWMRPAPPPAPSAAIPMWRGCARTPTSPRWHRCKSACCKRPPRCSSRAERWSIAPARWSRRRAKRPSRRFWPLNPACAGPRLCRPRWPESPKSSPPKAISAPCPATCRMPTRALRDWTVFTPLDWLRPDSAADFSPQGGDSTAFKMVWSLRFRLNSDSQGFPLIARHGVSVAQRRRISTLIMGRFARNALARASGGPLALSRLWPGRTDRLIIAPHDLRTADATRAAEIYAGRFVFAGKIVNCHGRSIFDLEPPSEDWEIALLGFGWLRHLRAADTALTRANARALVEDWISNPSYYRPVARRADVLARRVISLLSQAPLVLGATDNKFYRRYLRGLTREIRYLRYALLDMPDGLPRLQVLIAQCYASLCLANQAKHIRSTTRKLSDELQQQILPDGGHISRNPGALIELLIDLLPLRQTFAARNVAPPPALLNAIDRMMPMLRFFRHGDGSIALFNGMSGTPSDLLATLLAYDDTLGTPMASMPHSGFQRLDAGQMTVIMDTGLPPPANVSHDAHAGCLSFEMSAGPSRIVINCGMPSTARENWRAFARGTAAHSTLTCHETSSCQFLELSAMKKFLQGAPIVSGPHN